MLFGLRRQIFSFCVRNSTIKMRSHIEADANTEGAPLRPASYPLLSKILEVELKNLMLRRNHVHLVSCNSIG